jgi:hypothetical protein
MLLDRALDSLLTPSWTMRMADGGVGVFVAGLRVAIPELDVEIEQDCRRPPSSLGPKDFA